MKHELRSILEHHNPLLLNSEAVNELFADLYKFCDSLPDEPLTGSAENGCGVNGGAAGSTSDLVYAKTAVLQQLLTQNVCLTVKDSNSAAKLASLVNASFAALDATDMGEVSDGYHTFNDLYAHRVRLFSTLMCAYPDQAWWSHQHHDGSKMEGWILAGIDTPAGPVTYHLPVSEAAMLPIGTELERGKEWDGHTADDVLERLKSL